MSPSQIWASQVVLVGKNSPANAADLRDMDLKGNGEGMKKEVIFL